MKYARTFFTKPYNDHKVEIHFGSGYQNVRIIVDGKEVKKYQTAFQLLKPDTIPIPGTEDVLKLKFLRESVEFEVFYNDQQIDKSATSAGKITKTIGWTYSIVIGWYALILISVLAMSSSYGSITNIPLASFFIDPAVIYAFTSTFILLGLFVFGRIYLDRGVSVLYNVCLVSLILDGLYGAIFLMGLINSSSDVGFGDFLSIIIPGGVKGICIYTLISNRKKYEEYCNEKNSVFYKGSEDTIDL